MTNQSARERCEAPDHAWRHLVFMCKQERARLASFDSDGRMLQLMAAADSLNEIECMIPAEFWPDHESRDDGPVAPMEITLQPKDTPNGQ